MTKLINIRILFAILLVVLYITNKYAESFLYKKFLWRRSRTVQRSTAIDFKKQDDSSEGGSKNPFNSIWRGVKRFLPDISAAKLEKSYEKPVEDSGNRYHIRLIEPNLADKRHITTRILRYFPDMKWETANEIVERALEDGVSLIRVLNSKKDVEYIVDMFRVADPPINLQVYDNRKDELIVI